MRSLKVAMLIQDFLPIVGGAQRQLGMVAPWLKQAGINVQILTRHYPQLPLAERMNDASVYRLAAPGPKSIASGLYTWAAIRKLREIKPDLIHAYNLFSPLTTALLYKQLFGTPVIVKILRGGHLGDVDRLRKRFAGGLRLGVIRNNVDAFITISSEIDAELASLQIEPARRFYIPNGVDTNRFSPVRAAHKPDLRRQLNLPDGQLAIYTGRLVQEKRIRQLVEIWPAVSRDIPGAQLLLVGSGPEELPLRQAKIPGVNLVGQVEDVAPYLQAADLFVLPSATEGLSNAMLEAMAAGLPSVITRVGGAEDVITHLENGWLVDPDQPEQIQQAVIGLFSQPELMDRLGQAARTAIDERFALEIVGRQLVELYEAVLSGQQTGLYPQIAIRETGRKQ